MFYFHLLLSVIIGILIGFIPILDAAVVSDINLWTTDAIVFFGISGLIIGLSCFFLYNDMKRRRKILSVGDRFVIAFLLIASFSGRSLVEKLSQGAGSNIFLSSNIPLAMLLLFGFACYLGGKATQVLGRYGEVTEGQQEN